MEAKLKPTINSIILLRGIAALGVCFIHIQILTGIKANALVNYILANGQQGVVIFFVISGFILPYSLYKKQYRLKDFFNFLLKRVIRIDPPYWCCILLFILVIPVPVIKFTDIILQVSYLVPFIKSAHWYSDIFWTLAVEFQYYILLGLFYPVLMRLPVYWSILIVVVSAILCIGFNYRGIIIANIYQFTFGFIAFLAYTKLIEQKRFYFIFILYTILIIFDKSITSALVPAGAVLFIMLYNSDYKMPVLHFIGDISYSLYLIHIPVSIMLIRYFGKYFDSEMIVFTLCLLASVVFAYIFNKFIEKPSLNFSKRINLVHPDR